MTIVFFNKDILIFTLDSYITGFTWSQDIPHLQTIIGINRNTSGRTAAICSISAMDIYSSCKTPSSLSWIRSESWHRSSIVNSDTINAALVCPCAICSWKTSSYNTRARIGWIRPCTNRNRHNLAIFSFNCHGKQGQVRNHESRAGNVQNKIIKHEPCLSLGNILNSQPVPMFAWSQIPRFTRG